MSTNLHALIRYRILDECFQQQRRNTSWEELAQACGDALREYTRSDIENPSRRTIFGDIDTMKFGKLGYEAPIKFSKKLGYHYADPQFTINRQTLSPENRQTISEALFILKQFRGFAKLSGLDAIITHLEYDILGESNPYKATIQMDQSDKFKGLEWVEQLLQAIRSEVRVNLIYKPFTSPDPYTTDVSPYLIKEYNNRWYVAGYDHLNNRLQSYGLDRIVQIKTSDEPISPSPVDITEHYRKVIGITVLPDKQVERVVIRAITDQAFYIATKSIHHTQRIIREDPDATVFAMDLIPNFELESILLSFGERVEVLEPESLRQRIRERLDAARGQYPG
jgi:predicted DNA-binding transcriptional regulator YafY